ncbi:MAG: DNA polymerase IV [Verrucomicrobia bacterium]|nr:DNA polymerase IV [Verrucomicrobiota bacterium]
MPSCKASSPASSARCETSTRSILHLDADAFYASVEQAADSRLRGKPIAVGGASRGVIASASYEARARGVRTAMPTSRARRICPDLILVPGDFEKYERFSQLMFAYAYDLTPDVEICSIDEGYFDLSGQLRGHPRDSASAISKAIQQSLKITVSQGLATTKFASQVASKLRKPNSYLEVEPGREREFLAPLPTRWLPGIGNRTEPLYLQAGLARISQVADLSIEDLELLAGSSAPSLHLFAMGIDPRPVIPATHAPKSVGEQETFATDTLDENFALAVLRTMTDRLCRRLREDNLAARTLTLRIRYNDMEEVMRSESISEPSPVENDFYPILKPILHRTWNRRVSLRLVGVRLSNLHPALPEPELALTGLPQKSSTERLQLAEASDLVRRRYGQSAILRGHDLWLRQKLSSAGKDGVGQPLPSPGKN